ncbi:MAG: Excinuclease ABC, C subunit domain protein [Candidatus Roizmanbacteria bacterium GW2011_GWA2_32_13]|uniref:Excinuclease ABC, C subunit domain protein n=1 Tax=Candidatus Roizmanbacteria bacterium GW2011_GWA2_32_13 TaxID=1618475 RepID=A0A0G0BYW6_9BACT|nr:MAG: Excinuclease ABC, C subunit domain protein [Candidatus Roizmanbacteria bacterium GW2011_GWA2_32_13]
MQIMANPFTIHIYVPEGDPEGLRIIDRQSSPSKFFAFPRTKWDQIKNRPELTGAGIYILTGYSENEDELPTIYIGQADTIKNRIEQHMKNKDFWDKAVIFVSNNKINSTHAKWLEHKLIDRVLEANRSIVENSNSPQEPTISESEQAEMQVFLTEIYQTLPLVGLRAFEISKAVINPLKEKSTEDKNTIIVPAQKEGFDRVFLGENSWYAIRISGGKLDDIKYIAGYQTAPISTITHYAEVKSIEHYGEEGKYKLNFINKAKKLENEIENDLSPQAMQSCRYTSLNKLLKAKKMSELF